MAKIDFGSLSSLADVEQFAMMSRTTSSDQDGSLLVGFAWAAAFGIMFWIALALAVLSL